jgi:transcriptional regulator GlxA family with amidase domain
MAAQQIALIIYPDFMSLDLFGPLEVFNSANRLQLSKDKPAPYEVLVASTDGGPIPTESGVVVESLSLPPPSKIATALVVGGDGVDAARLDAELLAWLRKVEKSALRVGSICSGALVLAQSGLFDGRHVTTHWARASQLAREYHEVTVSADSIYVTDGKFWSSAGVTAGMDLALAMVEEDLGPETSQLIARWMVMHRHRPGGQSQYATPAWTPKAEQPALREVQMKIEQEPAMDCRLENLASLASMSVRHFCRMFAEQVGMTPARFVEHVRLDAVREKLETSTDTLEVIAESCGFGTAETLRRTFLRRLGVTPTQYRQTFHIDPN